ncbi:NADH dehydrogenase [ubiquinone] 1 beta subcomplex subunit 3 [Sceloporus undulatus]|uniref:NADH dehydrogenase [ubiquinone] 1 beta subcomplex subunit 3 n=1 Tax=Sceloporus undulatus TaxID=8520 RepID=UPI001C4AFDCA|nr:NADH dehydrogenase [ubiquinone] 1 beta subcomplex subunit 3 [Sceloporus undulatus]
MGEESVTRKQRKGRSAEPFGAAQVPWGDFLAVERLPLPVKLLEYWQKRSLRREERVLEECFWTIATIAAFQNWPNNIWYSSLRTIVLEHSVKCINMGHGHEHGHGKVELPDYKMWKIEGTPLEDIQERLARRGLRDPWLRNEAWRYMGGFAKPVTIMDVLGKGFKWGFAAFVVSLAIEYAFFPPKKDNSNGHH